MERTFVSDLKAGEEVLVKGWIYEIRDLAKLKFLLIRDMTGIVQCVVKGDELMEKTKDFGLEYSVLIKGKVKESNVKAEFVRPDIELVVEDIELINKAERLPIQINDNNVETELSTRLDNRFLDIRKPKIQAIFNIESTIMQAFREFMVKENRAMEAVFPSIIGASSEGGTELFKAKYFDREVFLSQSCQLYKQMLACSLERVFTIFTVWRAEKHNTIRHLNEARQFDYEEAFCDEFKVMEVLAKVVQFMVKELLEKNKKDLEILNVELKVPETKYLTFEEVRGLMYKEGVFCGEHDLNTDAEKKLGELYPDTIVFVHDWPIAGKPFYIMPKGEGLSGGFDAIYKGMEIASGGQRVHIPEILEKQLQERDLDPKDFKDYIDSFRYGAPPHAGWGMGLERLTMLFLGIQNIREVVLFPRDRTRITP
ncbi:aspartate--tRNA(Asn) ligase [archaeon]|nr:aspartate--tRNA(Asn) ligase [archaeon]